jgi:hypothetical protein
MTTRDVKPGRRAAPRRGPAARRAGRRHHLLPEGTARIGRRRTPPLPHHPPPRARPTTHLALASRLRRQQLDRARRPPARPRPPRPGPRAERPGHPRQDPAPGRPVPPPHRHPRTTPRGRPSGRLRRPHPTPAPESPRYLNTTDTALYSKSRLLLDLAEQADQLRASVMPAIVEGPLDVLAIAGSGAHLAAVSPCGTALTTPHADTLHHAACRRTGDLVATDSDTAGHAAAVRAHQLLGAHFGPLHALHLPARANPADLGPQPWFAFSGRLSATTVRSATRRPTTIPGAPT